MSPCNVQPASSSQRSVTKILPSTVPRTLIDFVLISPHMRACSPIVSVPVESSVPSSSPSMSSSFRNLTEPLIETPRERRAPDGVGVNVRLDGPGTTDGLADSIGGGRGFGLSSEHVHCVIPPDLAAWKAYLFPCATVRRSLSKWRANSPIDTFLVCFFMRSSCGGARAFP
jgi:hypothetical protein